jgi:organic radical activating enzyme
MIKTRIFKEHNYKAIYCNGKTLRVALNPKEEIKELRYPEFYDVKLTNHCTGECPWCYQDSLPGVGHFNNVVDKIKSYFGAMNENQRPFQIAYGGGEPTSLPEFVEVLKVSDELGITPNYTTNGKWIVDETGDRQLEIIEATKKYSGGVAVSCHPHLRKYWERAAEIYLANDIKLNFHVIISDRESIDYFKEIFDKWRDKIDYFVLLPHEAQGRADEKVIDWDYLVEIVPENAKEIAFGANFYPFLIKDPSRFNVSLYEPESMSGYLDLSDMKLYKSSFLLEEKFADHE